VQEIRRREKAIDEGKAELVAFEDVMAQAEAILNRPRKRKSKP